MEEEKFVEEQKNEESVIEKIRNDLLSVKIFDGKGYNFEKTLSAIIEDYGISNKKIVREKLFSTYFYRFVFKYNSSRQIEAVKEKTNFEEFVKYVYSRNISRTFYQLSHLYFDNTSNAKVAVGKTGYVWFIGRIIKRKGFAFIEGETKMKIIKYYLRSSSIDYENEDIRESQPLRKMGLTGGGGWWILWRPIVKTEKEEFEEFLKSFLPKDSQKEKVDKDGGE